MVGKKAKNLLPNSTVAGEVGKVTNKEPGQKGNDQRPEPETKGVRTAGSKKKKKGKATNPFLQKAEWAGGEKERDGGHANIQRGGGETGISPKRGRLAQNFPKKQKKKKGNLLLTEITGEAKRNGTNNETAKLKGKAHLEGGGERGTRHAAAAKRKRNFCKQIDNGQKRGGDHFRELRQSKSKTGGRGPNKKRSAIH